MFDYMIDELLFFQKKKKKDLYSDTMLNNHLSQNLKLIRMNKFDHLIYILTLLDKSL
jgi:hypothetical protein